MNATATASPAHIILLSPRFLCGSSSIFSPSPQLSFRFSLSSAELPPEISSITAVYCSSAAMISSLFSSGFCGTSWSSRAGIPLSDIPEAGGTHPACCSRSAFSTASVITARNMLSIASRCASSSVRLTFPTTEEMSERAAWSLST